MGNKWAAWMLIPVLTVTTAACGNGIDVAEKSNDGVSSPVKSVSTDPVTLSLYNNAGIADSYMEEYVLKHIKSKYPHMTVNYLKPETGKTLNDLISAGSIPDIVLCTISNLLLYTSETGLLTDLTPLIKEQGMDIGKFKDGLIDAIKSYSDKGEIYALPWSINQVSVYYNKDLFDKFGVSYPKDGMT